MEAAACSLVLFLCLGFGLVMATRVSGTYTVAEISSPLSIHPLLHLNGHTYRFTFTKDHYGNDVIYIHDDLSDLGEKDLVGSIEFTEDQQNSGVKVRISLNPFLKVITEATVENFDSSYEYNILKTSKVTIVRSDLKPKEEPEQ